MSLMLIDADDSGLFVLQLNSRCRGVLSNTTQSHLLGLDTQVVPLLHNVVVPRHFQCQVGSLGSNPFTAWEGADLFRELLNYSKLH